MQLLLLLPIRALKMHGGVPKTELSTENLVALEKGPAKSFAACCKILKKYLGLPAVVAVNRFPTDTGAEMDLIIRKCKELGINARSFRSMGKKAAKAESLLLKKLSLLPKKGEKNFKFSYSLNDTIKEKINAVATKNLSCIRLHLLQGCFKRNRAA